MMMKRALLVAALVAGPAQGAVPQKGPAKNIEPRAEQVLRGMSNYLAGLRTFRVESSAVDEVVLKSGQKIQQVTDSQVSVLRPNHLHSQRLGPGPNLAFWYDGKALTTYCNSDNTYSTVPAPPSLDAMIDMARAKYGIEAPGADLIFSRPYEVLTEDATSGQYIGKEIIDGVATHHLAFRAKDVDWQIWVQDGAQPLPRRYVITTKTVQGQPQFTVSLSRWEVDVGLPAAALDFQPPPGATRSDKFPVSCGAGSVR